MRIDKVYTRGGDAGQTSLIGGDRVDKDADRIEAYGTVDELNAILGLVCTALAESSAGPTLLPILRRVQNELFNLGSALATPDPTRRRSMPRVESRHVEALERDIDSLNENLPQLASFVLPGGGWVSSYLHLARTVCRRAERVAIRVARTEDVCAETIVYLNRLSDALFVFGRWAVHSEGGEEPLWMPEST